MARKNRTRGQPKSQTGRKVAKKGKSVKPKPASRPARGAARTTTARPPVEEPRTTNRPAQKEPPRPATAEDMARRQREISVAEFFTKNRHLLGFDNPRKALLTTIKEGVDNSLDACEEAGILPEIKVVIAPGTAEDRFRVTIEDNGPGIVKAQLTTGKPIVITSKTSRHKPAHHYELEIDTQKNEPRILVDDTVAWPVERGTRVEIELEAKYQKGRQSVEEYLEQTAIANPHVSLQLTAPDGQILDYRRATDQLPPETREIKPHPYGVELGALIKMLHDTRATTLQSFLHGDFSRVSLRVAKQICAQARLYERARPARVARQEADNLFQAINQTKIMNPPTDCLSPIGEDLILAGLKKQIEADFYTAVTRPPAVYRGNPFQIEAGLAFGGSLPADGLARLLRYANRVPLLYQQAACATTRSVLTTGWRNYALPQAAGALPSGPLVILVHMASVWVPFTSESKEAIAHYPEIIREIRLALQECGRRLSVFLRRRRRAAESERKKAYVQKYIPHIAIALREMLQLSDHQEKTLVTQLTDVLERDRS
jgi:DNA topoisomerase-6 subunit B